jgi:hypothetical protein
MFARALSVFAVLVCLLAGASLWARGAELAVATQAASPVLKWEVFARPTADKPEAGRKINELFLHDGCLYVGHGCYSANTGPTDIFCCNLANGNWRVEGRVDDEAIVQYRLLDGRLVIPGIDATEDWSFGNLYVRGADGWSKRCTIPNGLHVYDIASYRGRWYAITHGVFVHDWGLGENIQPGVGMVHSSGDQGQTWRFEYACPVEANADTFIRQAIAYGDRLYVFPTASTYHSTPEMLERFGEKRQPYDDFLGNPDALAFDGYLWRPANLVDEPNVRAITPVPGREVLGLWVEFGRGSPYNEDRRRSGARFFVFDGQSAQVTDLECLALRDAVRRDEVTYLLMSPDGSQWFIAALFKTALIGR